MTEHDRLAMLKIDIKFSSDALDARLTQYLQSAQVEIEREGITLDFSDIGDNQLVVMYAAWMWRNRDSMKGMPRMLRYALNNRLISQKVGGK